MVDADREEAGWIRGIQRSRSRAALTALVERYYGEINRYLGRQLPDREIAADLTQEVFVAVLRHIDRFDPRRASFRTWLYRIATNKVVDHARKRRRWGPMGSLDGFDVADPSDVAEWIVDADLARRAVATLGEQPARVQQIVRLKVFAGKTFAEIADVLDLPEATAKTTYYRGLARLRKEMDDE